MSICYTFADLGICPEPTTILGNIEAWAHAYIDTGLHADDWMCRMDEQHKHFEKSQRSGDSAVEGKGDA